MAESVVVPWALVSGKGCVRLDAAPASVFLRTSPHGAYTTTRTGNEGERLLLWERHLRRLAQSMEVLAEAMPERFPRRPPGSFSRLQDLVQPSLQAGLQSALALRRPGEELNITILASPDEKLTWDVTIHLSSYTPTQAQAHLAILGSGRVLPQAKYSQWATARAPLEQSKPPWATEILLSHDGDRLLEGAITNFFVVTDSELQTAPLEAGVLPGVIRQLVIEVCHEQGIPVKEATPSWREREAWVEGFLTSSLRMVQSVETIRRGEEEVRFERTSSVTERIRSRVLERALDEGLPVLEFLHKSQHSV